MTKEYSLVNGVFSCVINDAGHYGSIVINFIDGHIEANKPETWSFFFWITVVSKVLGIAFKMAKPFDNG